MSEVKIFLSTHVLDTSRGVPGRNIGIRLYKLSEGSWIESSNGLVKTDENGRFNNFKKIGESIPGTYRLRFEIEEYFERDRLESLYPYIEITFKIKSNEHYHIPLIVTPFSFSSYRGS